MYDRITMFSDHMVRDINAGRFPEDTNMILCTHGLTLRLFLMRWFHWTVAEYERIANPSNSQPIILERRSIEDIEHSEEHPTSRHIHVSFAGSPSETQHLLATSPASHRRASETHRQRNLPWWRTRLAWRRS